MELPEWLEKNIPAPSPIEYITYRDGSFWFRNWPYETVVDAYDAAKPETNVDFDDAARAAAGWTEDDWLLTSGNRILPISTEQTQRWLIEEAFKTAVERIHKWRQNKDDFRLSYSMLDTHPAFWTRPKAEPTFHWEDDGFVSSKFWFALSSDGMMMECGGHVEPELNHNYHDLRLDTYGASFEDCIIQTAALVDKFFHSNGVPRENVEYEKSELEKTLEARMREAGLTPDE